MFDQELEIKIEMMQRAGWSVILRQDVCFPLKTANVIPFRNSLKKCLEEIINTNIQMVSMNSLQEWETVLKFTYYHRSQVDGYRDQIVHHIKMTEEGWRSGIVMFAEKIWRS